MENKKVLTGAERKFLRGLAHNLKPSASVGQKGLTRGVLDEIDTALEALELIKVKFIDFKEKDEKKAIVQKIEESVNCEAAGIIGHVAILFRQNKDIEKQKINLPE